MIYFLVMFMFLVFTFSLQWIIANIGERPKDEGLDINMIVKGLRVKLMFIFGQIARQDSMSAFEWVILNCFLLLVNVTSLNLLIAIIEDTYDKVQSAINVFHIKTKADILLEVASFYKIFEESEEDLVHFYIFHNSNQGVI